MDFLELVSGWSATLPLRARTANTGNVRVARQPGVLEVALCLPGAQKTLARIAMNLALLPQFAYVAWGLSL
jgi:hypothetical protein